MVTNLSSSSASLTRTSLLAVIFNSRVQTMLFHWSVSYCFSEHTCRPSHTPQPWCAFGCTSRKILNTTNICLTAARGQMRAELMRTRGSRELPTCAASRNRPIALPGELVCGRLYGCAYSGRNCICSRRQVHQPVENSSTAWCPQNQNENRFIPSYYRPRRPLLRPYLVAVAEATCHR